MATILLVGAGGRMGAALAESYSAAHEIIPINRQALDLGNENAIRDAIAGLDFDVAINCAALTNVDYCETHREEAFAINAVAVSVIAKACQKKSARLIQISTDYVFDGEKQEGYVENDKAVPISVYGESKLAGEEAALEVSQDNLVIRVSWVFGPHRPSFVDMMLRRAANEENISAVGDKFSTPSYTADLGVMLSLYLNEIPAGGILHLSNGGGCSWCEYAQHALNIAREIGLPMKAKTVESIPLDSLTAFVAQRPRHTVMLTNRYTAETGKNPTPWQDAVREYVTQYGEIILRQ